jgi:hypothetical protein
VAKTLINVIRISHNPKSRVGPFCDFDLEYMTKRNYITVTNAQKRDLKNIWLLQLLFTKSYIHGESSE